MQWILCFAVALIISAAGVVQLFLPRTSHLVDAGTSARFRRMAASVFAAATVLFLPIYGEIFAGEPLRWLKVLLLSVHNTIRLFIVDGEFTIVTDHLTADNGWIFTPYSVLFAALFVAAPLLTFGVVLSFFKNVSAYRRYDCGYFRDAYVFSELNERSLALAESLFANAPRRMLVFTDVFEKNEETSYELLKRARRIGAIVFRDDIRVVRLKFHSPHRKLCFFTIGEDETENMEQAIRLIEKYRTLDNTHLFAFSTSADSELLLTDIDKGRMKVRRVEEVRALINRILYEDGEKIFAGAQPAADGTEKQISALVIGLGQYGTHMLKSLSWFCQMDGYRINIHAFDRDPLAYDKLYAQCPELLSDAYNGVYLPGEAQYRIDVRSGIDVWTRQFADAVAQLTDATYVLVALGSDQENIRAAVYLRMLFERMHIHPVIQTIVYSAVEKSALCGICNYRGQPYDIRFSGDTKTSYSEKTILDSALEADALARHLKWDDDEESFWRYEYNYRSSVATAIHMRARIACGIPGADKKIEDRTPAEAEAMDRLEHRRWNAYMRSEGYIYSGSPDKASRNDLAKMHHDLVDFLRLTEEEKRKDSRVSSV